MLKRFCLQPDSDICFWGWSWCEQGEGGRKIPRRICRLCKHGEGLGELLPLPMSLLPRSLTLYMISDALHSRLESDMRAEHYLTMVGERLVVFVYCPSYC